MKMEDEPNSAETEDVRFEDLAPAIEFCCWTVVFISPLLRFINGAAVTEDQWWMQISLFSLSLIGALTLRVYLLLASK